MAAIAIVSSLLSNVYSETRDYGGELQNGVTNICVYLDYDSGVGYWETYIQQAVNNWMHTGWSNPIYMTFVNSSYGSTLDFYAQDNSLFNVPSDYVIFAETRFFASNNNRVYPDVNNAVNWKFAQIHINDDNFRLSEFTSAMAGGTVRHEIGHALGLAHNTATLYSIMSQIGDIFDSNPYNQRQVQTDQYIDNQAL